MLKLRTAQDPGALKHCVEAISVAGLESNWFVDSSLRICLKYSLAETVYSIIPRLCDLVCYQELLYLFS